MYFVITDLVVIIVIVIVAVNDVFVVVVVVVTAAARTIGGLLEGRVQRTRALKILSTIVLHRSTSVETSFCRRVCTAGAIIARYFALAGSPSSSNGT